MTGLKALTRAALCRRPISSAFTPLTRGHVPVLMLHRFADPASEHGGGHDTRQLRRNLEYLRRAGYRFLSLGEALGLVERGEDVRRAVVFTVDDGYGDFRRMAWPVFSENECPVTVFIVSGFLDGSCWCWWDRVEYAIDHARRRRVVLELGGAAAEYAWDAADDRRRVTSALVRRLKEVPDDTRLAALEQIAQQVEVRWPDSVPPRYAPLSWDDVRFLGRHGVTFGPHSVSHPILSRTTTARAEQEIRTSWTRLQSETDAVVPVFCYPNGEPQDFGAREMEIVRQDGLTAAVGTHPGFVSGERLRRTPYALPRFAYPEERDDLVQIVCGLERAMAGLRGA